MHRNNGIIVTAAVVLLGVFTSPTASAQQTCKLSAFPSGPFTLYFTNSLQLSLNNILYIDDEQGSGQAEMPALKTLNGAIYSSEGVATGTGSFMITQDAAATGGVAIPLVGSASGPFLPISYVSLFINVPTCTIAVSFNYWIAGSQQFLTGGGIESFPSNFLSGDPNDEFFPCVGSISNAHPFTGQTSEQVTCSPTLGVGSYSFSWSLSPIANSCPANASTVFPFAGGNKSKNGLPTAMLATFSPSTAAQC